MAKYSLKSKTHTKQGHGTLLILPLAIITLFCFGYTYAQSKSYQASHGTAASKTSDNESKQAQPISDQNDSSVNKLDAAPESSAAAGSGSQPAPATKNQSSDNEKAISNQLEALRRKANL